MAASEAHDSGLCAADPATKARFARDLRNLTLASPNPLSDRRKEEKESVEKEQRDPQAHYAGGVDAGEDPAALLVDDNDLADRDFSQWGAVGPEFDCPQPVELCGAVRFA